MRRGLATLVAVALVAAVPAGVRAEARGETQSGHPELRRDPIASWSVTLGSWALVAASETALKSVAPLDACRWCASNPLDDGVRSALKWNDTSLANTLSYATLVLPLAAAGLGTWESHRADAPYPADDLLIVSEAAGVTALLTQVFKFALARERPFVHALPEAEKARTSRPGDNAASFFSGHTSIAFALAASAGTVASMREYDAAPWIWGIGGVGAMATGLLRIGADKHWFTDVVAGAAVGTTIGILMPRLLHPPVERGATREGTASPVRFMGNMVVLAW